MTSPSLARMLKRLKEQKQASQQAQAVVKPTVELKSVKQEAGQAEVSTLQAFLQKKKDSSTGKTTTIDGSNGASSGSGANGVDTTTTATANSVAKALNKDEVNFDNLNAEQRQAVVMAESKHSFCLVGSAGTGKTTTVRTMATTLSSSGVISRLTEGTERVLSEGKPAIAVLSFTNQAVRNIKEALPQEFKQNCSTFHTLLEYYPCEVEIPEIGDDGKETGFNKESQRFVPTYGCQPDGLGDGAFLPHLDIVVVEEGGSVPMWLWETFYSALPRPDDTTFIFLGDLNQLPPVFDDAILGFKLLELPIIELGEVYRNTGLVTKLAQRILEGKPMGDKEAETWNQSDHSGTVSMKPFAKRHPSETSCMAIGTYFKKLIIAGEFDPQYDMVLVPFNKAFGTLELNKWIGQGLAERDGLEVHQVISNYHHFHFCVGDKVLHNKEYWFIDSIEPNTDYTGAPPLPPSPHVDRWGRISTEHEAEVIEAQQFNFENADIDDLLDAAVEVSKTRNSTQSSAVIRMVNCQDPSRTATARSAGQVSNLLLVGAMTVHKAQGSEAQRVWLILHHSHSTMVNRELVYTGVTRARRDITIMYDKQNPVKAGDSMLQKGITTQKLKGNTLDKKLDYYRSKVRAEKLKLELAKKRASQPALTITKTAAFQ